MITDTFPVGVQSPGNNLVVAVPTLTTPLAPKLSDIGATALDLTDYLKADALDIGFDQVRDDDTRLGDATKRETFGVASVSQDEIAHIQDPQAANTVTGNKASATLVADTTIYVVIRLGKPRATALAIGDIVDVYQVALGKAAIFPQPSGKYLRRIKTSWTRVTAAPIALVA